MGSGGKFNVTGLLKIRLFNNFGIGPIKHKVLINQARNGSDSDWFEVITGLRALCFGEGCDMKFFDREKGSIDDRANGCGEL